MPEYVGSTEWNTLLKRLKDNDSTLTSIDLTSKYIGDSGAKELGEALKVNCTLTLLVLCSNRIGNFGTKCLSEALKVNWTLK